MHAVWVLLALCVGLVSSFSWDIILGRSNIQISNQGQPKCRCNVDHTSERCDVSVCENYCSQGDCAVSAEGQPKCRCNAGYTGGRCDTSVCENYCLQGDCYVSAEGQPKCRCNAGYTGMRCDVSVCHKHCLNNGTCSLNQDNEPVCQCTGQYEGERCDVLTTIKTEHTTTTATTTTTDPPTTPRENIESTTNKSSEIETISHETPYEGFHWLTMVDGKLPPNAVIGGFEDGNATYIARAYHRGSLCPGKYLKSSGIAYVSWGGLEHRKEQFEILCGSNAKWVKTNYDNIPENAMIGGRTGGSREIYGEPLYVCRNYIESSLVCGKAYARTAKCYLPYEGLEKEITSYEILIEE